MMHGLGVISPAVQRAFLEAIWRAGGCTDAVRQGFSQMPCLTMDYATMFGSCIAGLPPDDMNPLAFAAVCQALTECGVFLKPGCAGDAPSVAEWPECYQDTDSDLASIEYCGRYPNFQGPDRTLNAACWVGSRWPTAYRRVLDTPRCSALAPPAPPPPVYSPPAPPRSETTPTPVLSPPAYTAPPAYSPPAYSPPAYDMPPPAPPADYAPPSSYTPDDSTPSSVYPDDGGAFDVPPDLEPLPERQRMSMRTLGIIGAVVVGVGAVVYVTRRRRT